MAKLIGKDETVKTEESADTSLATLQPEEQFVMVNGRPIYVRPFTFAKLLKALKHISNLIGFLDSNGAIEQNMLLALANHGDDVIGLLTLSTGEPKEFFDDLDASLGLDLAVMTYKVNESFFVENLLPKLQEIFPSDSPEETENQESTPMKAKAKKATGSTSSKS